MATSKRRTVKPKAAPVTMNASADSVGTPTLPSKTARPTTCGALFATMPQFAAKGCKRLPRHNGEHRSSLKAVAAPKAAKVTAKVTRKAAPKGPKVALPVYTLAMAKADPTSVLFAGNVSPKGSTKAATKAARTSGHPSIAQTTSAAKRRAAKARISELLDSGVLTADAALELVAAIGR